MVSSQSLSFISTAVDNTGSVDTIQGPQGLAYDGTNLYVSDPFNDRVLVFTPGDVRLPDNSVVNAASEIIRQEGVVTLGLPGTIAASDTVTITINGTNYAYTLKRSLLRYRRTGTSQRDQCQWRRPKRNGFFRRYGFRVGLSQLKASESGLRHD